MRSVEQSTALGGAHGWVLAGAPVWAGPERGIAGDAVAFRDGRVAAVGPEREVRARLPRAELVRVRGGLVVPGFVDAHLHVRACASAALAADAGGVDGVGRLLELVARAAQGRPRSSWVSVSGFEPRLLGPALAPSRLELDRVAPAAPVRIRHRSLHAWLLNSAALQVAVLDRRVPAGVTLLRDEAGEPTGWVLDHGGRLRERLGPAWPPETFEQAVAEWSAARLREGVVAVLDASASNDAERLRQLADWHRRGILAQRVAALIRAPSPSVPAGERVAEGASLRDTAGLAASRGWPVPSPAGWKLMPEPGAGPDERVLLAAWQAGARVAVHCADLEGLGALLEAVERLPPARRGPLRVEHAAICPPEWLPRVARSGATVVGHPGFVHAHGDRYLAEGPALPAGWLHRLHSWTSVGAPLAFGSDAPAGPVEPLTAWRAARTRRTSGGRILGRDEALGPFEALAGLTAWAADCSALEGYGRIQEGGPGAAVLLGGEPLVDGAEEGVRVRLVVAAGAIVAREQSNAA
jgi:predicted amidohydrolase YtcJ